MPGFPGAPKEGVGGGVGGWLASGLPGAFLNPVTSKVNRVNFFFFLMIKGTAPSHPPVWCVWQVWSWVECAWRGHVKQKE